MNALLFLSVCAASAVADGDFCFPRGFGGTENPICLSWARNGADFEFAMNCTPDGHPEFSVGWCAVGLSTATPPGAPLPATWGMWPAEVFHLQATRSAAGSAPVVELTDRLTVGARLPACMPTQASQLLSAHVDAATGVLSARFRRRAELPPKLLAQGFTSLNRTLPLIAAISNAQGALPPVATAGCAASFPAHDNEWWNNQTASFA
jgi:hypothetical protein